MNRRQIDLQIRAVMITYRVELRRQDSPTMEAFRARAEAILESVALHAGPYPDIQAAIAEAREEVQGAGRNELELSEEDHPHD